MPRRKSRKNSTGGRRSSGQIVKKSPVRRNLRSSAKNSAKKIFDYSSPLLHLKHNGPSSSSSPSTSKSVKTEMVEGKSIKQDPDAELSTAEMSSPSLDLSSIKKSEKEEAKEENNQESDQENISNESINDSPQVSIKRKKGKKVSLNQKIWTGEKLNYKKKKLNKSLLSRFKDSTLDSSVILLDDSESSLLKPTLDDSHEPNEPKPNQSCLGESTIDSLIFDKGTNSNSTPIISNTTKPPSESTDVVVIDCNDSSLMDMDLYHDKFNQSENSAPMENMCSDSVIIIDPDDEPSVEKPNQSESEKESTQQQSLKTNEDVLVVWSSMPQPASATASTSSAWSRFPRPQSSFDSNADILKQDKILLDTSPNMSNFRLLNNEINKPKKKIMKAPKGNSFKGKSILSKSTILECSKVMANTKRTADEAAAKAKLVAKSAAKGSQKSKTNKDLIFLSTSNNEADAKKKAKKGKPREIVIDGSNIGMAYTNHKSYSEKGIKMLIDYFTKKGHAVKVFVPQHRRSRNFPMLEKWYEDGIVVFTPSRKLGNKSYTPYDDRYILEYAIAQDGIIVSQDQFRDLYAEKPEYRDAIENNVLVPTFVGDYVMFPEDPLGRNGPTLANFLKH